MFLKFFLSDNEYWCLKSIANLNKISSEYFKFQKFKVFDLKG